MKHCINLPSHVGKQSHVFSCSCQRKPNSEYRNLYFSSHSLIARPNLCKNLPTNAMFSFKLGSEDNGAVKSLPVLWRSKAFPYIALPPPGVGSSAFFSQYFYTADTFCQDRYRNSVCTFQGPEDTHRTWLTWTAPRTLFHACSALDLDLHVSSGLGNHGGLGSVIGQPVYSPTSAALDYQQVFLGRLWTYMLGALLQFHLCSGQHWHLSWLALWNAYPLLLCDSSFHFLWSLPLLFLGAEHLFFPCF